MGLFGGLFDNPAIKNAAFSGLRKLMNEEQLTCIILINNPSQKDGPIPGFDVQMYRETMQLFDMDTVGIAKKDFEMISRTFDALEALGGPVDDEVIELITRYHRAKKLNNGDIQSEGAGETDSHGAESEPSGNGL